MFLAVYMLIRMQIHNQATAAASSTYKTLREYMPSESAFMTTIGGCQLYGSIWLTVFGYGFNPRLYVVGYIAAFAHIMLGGLITHRHYHSKRWWVAAAAVAVASVGSSIGIVYHLREDNTHLIISLMNFYSIFVVTVWGGAAIYAFGAAITKTCAHRSRDILAAYPDSNTSIV